MDETLRELYQEVIIDHNRHPRHKEVLADPTHEAEGHNPLCGDQLKLYLIIKDDIIQQASFMGEGCAISTASASLMTDYLTGQSIATAREMFHNLHQVLTGNQFESSNSLGKLAVLCGVKAYPARVKCASLAWHTLDAALNNAAMASTE